MAGTRREGRQAVKRTSPRVPCPRIDIFHRHVPATAAEVSAVRHALEQWASANGCTGDTVTSIALAAQEAMANVVDHAYPAGHDGSMAVFGTVDAATVMVTVSDLGRWNPAEPARPAVDAPEQQRRGRGLMLIDALCEHSGLISDRFGTTLRMRWTTVEADAA
ncbi:ATP-binding protein [Amycolatopsis antarctica]|uniref:ATP-binding protein n=1 Tax=Amycolatopsis antarctica TaxID=1854586 RepID=UPI0013FD83B7|nr:ATP-binding protein [Amycolatopsis antarctica]